jgi:alcohol dehydrogenase (cytochrome c)
LAVLSLSAQAQAPNPGPSGGLSPGISLPPSPKKLSPLDKLSPVTDAALINPSAGDWLTWRRTYDDLGFSPLKQINRSNVADLRVAWVWSLPNGPNEATPLVRDGVLFVHSFGDKVQALDAVTGDLLWQYSRELPKDIAPTVKRHISIYGDKLFIPTSDIHVVALDIKTGKVVWDHAVASFKEGFRMTGGPLVAKGKVMIGTGAPPAATTSWPSMLKPARKPGDSTSSPNQASPAASPGTVCLSTNAMARLSGPPAATIPP